MPEHWYVTSGQNVWDFAGTRVGEVGDVGPDGFELRRDGSSLWLRNDAIYQADLRNVHLICWGVGLSRWAI